MSTTIGFGCGQIYNFPEIKNFVRLYREEMIRRKMPSTWPDSEHIHQAHLSYNDEPITMIMFAPLKLAHDQDSVGKNVYVAGAYTRPSWRRTGLYSDLVNLMVDEWRLEDSYDWLRGGFHLNNEASRAMQLSQGREFYEVTQDYQRTRLSLRPLGTEEPMSQEKLRPILEKLDRLSGITG